MVGAYARPPAAPVANPSIAEVAASGGFLRGGRAESGCQAAGRDIHGERWRRGRGDISGAIGPCLQDLQAAGAHAGLGGDPEACEPFRSGVVVASGDRRPGVENLEDRRAVATPCRPVGASDRE